MRVNDRTIPGVLFLLVNSMAVLVFSAEVFVFEYLVFCVYFWEKEIRMCYCGGQAHTFFDIQIFLGTDLLRVI